MIRAALLGLVLVSSAWAQLPGEGGVGVLIGGDVLDDAASELGFDSSVFSGSMEGDRPLITTGPLVTLLGQTIGDVATEFASTVVFDGRTIDFDAVTDLMWPDPLILDTENVGGTAAASNIEINPSSNANYTGSVNLCADAPNVGTTSHNCVEIWPDGITVGLATTLSAIAAESTVTQNSNGLLEFPATVLVRDDHTHSITDNTITRGGVVSSFYASPTYNKTGTGTPTVDRIAGFEAVPTMSNSGGGSLTFEDVYGFNAGLTTIGAGVTVDNYYGLYVTTPANAGTLTDAYGVFVTAMAAGTNRNQYGAAEHTITGTVNPGEGIWGVETGSPSKFYFKGEDEHIHRMGYATAMGSGVAMNTGATHYFPINDRLTTTATEGNADVPVPGALKVMHVACAVDVAPDTGGGVQSWTFTVSADTADVTGTSCAIADTATSCSASIAAGTAVASGVMWNWQVVPSGTPTASDGTCTVWWNLDAF